VSRSIYWKITIPLIILVLLTMGGLGLYVVNTAKSTQINNLEAQLLNEAELVANISTPGFADPSNNGNLDTIAKSIGNEIGTRVTLIGVDGTVLGDTDQNPLAMENHSTRPEVIAALSSGAGHATRYSATLKEDMLYVAVPVIDQGKTIGIARVSLPLTAVRSSVNGTAITIAIAVGVSALLVIIATAVITRMITRPVRRITKAAEAISSGKLDQQIQVYSRDEIGRLGHAFNDMTINVKNAMSILADERSRLSAILSGLSDGVVMTDAAAKIILANPAAEKLFKFKQTQIVDKPLIEVIPDHEIDNLVKKCLNTVSEQIAQIDSMSGRFLRTITVPITTGEIKGALILFQDLTEMRSLQTMRREFVGNISHELRTPLAAIKAIVDTLRDGAIDDQLVAGDFLNRLDIEVDGMTQMVNELIELSRIETGKIKLKLEPVNLNKLAEEVIARLTPQADRHQLSIITKLLSDLPLVRADRERIQQVMVNILHNAIKYTPAGGKIEISTRLDGQTVITQVSDTGIGISPDDLPHIFERFFKADKSRSSGGTGLGLAIAKHTVQIHGGSVWVRSELGKGSTFGFNLPLQATPQN
jgi:two-component system, OmpR family, phosphate regulon sensor histidine kinase PhoR